MNRRRHLRATVVKLVVFALVSVVATTVVVATLLNLDTSPTHSYRAIFANADGLEGNDIVAIAGVEVGSVNSVSLWHDRAVVDFSVNSNQQLTTTTRAEVGFQDLLGDRYLMLEKGSGPGRPLRSGATIPESRTNEGLDLTALFDGFQPLFSALTPKSVNELTASIIDVFQGESNTLSGLLSQTASFTTNLADRGQIIDEVIDNLTPLLTSVSDHDAQLSSLITGLDRFVDGLSSDRGQIDAAITNAGKLTGSLSRVLTQSEEPLGKDISGLATASGALARDQNQIGGFLRNLAPFVRTLTKVSDSGNYLSVYLCNLTIHTQGTFRVSLVPGVTATIALPTGPIGDQSDHTANCR